jgi:pyruvate-formate lyase
LISAPKWGNDDDEADRLMADVWKWTAERVGEETHAFGKPLWAGRNGQAWHYWYGKMTGALPDGRKAYTSLAPGALDPMTGTDIKGPTALINSASKLDYTVVNDAVFNMKFLPSLLQTRGQIEKLLSLIKTFFDRYGFHIQFNIIGKETLLDAQKHPEQYRGLIVRVAGYSAYFVELSPDLQDEIIARTEQAL